MNKELEGNLLSLFLRTSGPVFVSAKEELEKEIMLGGKKRSADYYSFNLSSKFLKIEIKEIYVHKTIFKEEESVRRYVINSKEVEQMSARSVMRILSKAGFSVPLWIKENEKDNFEIPEERIERNEEGLALFFSSASSCSVNRLDITLKRKNESSYYISTSASSDIPLDLSLYSNVFLGLDSLSEETDRDIRRALISYLDSLNALLLALSFKRLNIITYMSFLERMEKNDGDFEFTIKISEKVKEAEAITPLDFSYYQGFYEDRKEQRAIFFSYLDSLSAPKEEKDEEKDRAYYLSKLGLKIGATNDEIKSAYRTLSKRLHPDNISYLNLDKEFTDFAQKRMQEINEAYKNLTELY